MEIVYRKLSELKPNPKNPRKSTEEAIEKLAESIKGNPKFFEARPILLSDRTGQLVIIGGERRSEAAALLKMEAVPTILLSGLTEAEEDEILIKDNTHAGVWDEKKLQAWGKDQLQSWNVDGVKWSKLAAEAKEDDFDPDKKVKARCKRGDIWKLGNHRLMCGDSTKRADFEKLMGGGKADLTFTSPPYNGNNELGSGDVFQRKNTQRLYADGYSDDLPSSEYIKFASSVLEICFENTDGFIFWNVNYNSNSKYEYIAQIIPFLSKLIEQVVWKKSSAIPLKGCMRRGWEPVYIFSNTRKNLGTEDVETNIWEISNTNANGDDHKACFPVGLPSKGISLVRPKTGIVLDPFGGTGTTMIASEQLGRKCYMMELDPHYCDVIIDRWEKFTGQKAKKVTG